MADETCLILDKSRLQMRIPGSIAVVFYGNPQQLEYDFRIAPGANPKMIRLNAVGADSATLDQEGNLVLGNGRRQLAAQASRRAYQTIAKCVRKPVHSEFHLMAKNTVQIELGAYDTSQPLVVDPVLLYAVALGGSNANQGVGIDVDATGNAYVTGNTCSMDFPSSAGNFQNIHSNIQLKNRQDAFVLKTGPDGFNATLL